MTLQDLAAVGELIAAAATVVTLWYLAVQIRQSAELERGSQSQDHVRWRTDLLQPLVSDRAMAELWMRGRNDFGSLDDVDRQRLIFWESRALTGWSHYYHMRQKGLVDDPQWNELLHIFRWIGGSQAMKEAWLATREAYDPGFQALMDQYIAAPAPPSPQMS